VRANVAGAALAAFVGFVAPAAAASPFADLSVDQAIARAEAEAQRVGESRLVVVVLFASSWMPAAERLERTVWADARVRAWFDRGGVLVRVDPQTEPETAERFGVEAYPMLLALRDGEAAAATFPSADAEEMLQWLDQAATGEGALHATHFLELPLPEWTAANLPIRRQMDHAERLFKAGRHREALAGYVWLWDEIPTRGRGFIGARGSFMAGDIADLIAAYPPARRPFEQRRDEARAAVDLGVADRRLVRDWVVLTEMLGGTDELIAWFERNLKNEGRRDVLGVIASRLDRELMDAGRWTVVGRFMDSPEEELFSHTFRPDLPEQIWGDDPESRASYERRRKASFREAAGRAHAAYLAAGRDADAQGAAAIVLKHLDDAESRVALVEWALRAGQGGDAHGAWLDEAAERDADAETRERIDTLRQQLAGEAAVAG
jgi:hypothetical protein